VRLAHCALQREEFDGKLDKLFSAIADSRQEQIAAINRVDDRLVDFIAGKPVRKGS
jgi:hypothetical protein